MGKQHQTFPGEEPEMPGPAAVPEIRQPSDPREPEIPKEDPQAAPGEFPPENTPPEEGP